MGTLDALLQIAHLGTELGQFAEAQKRRDQQATVTIGQLSASVHLAVIHVARQELFILRQFAFGQPKDCALAPRVTQVAWAARVYAY